MGPMDFIEFWHSLDTYSDVRESVVANMKSRKILKKVWAVDTDVGRIRGGYALNKDHEKIRKILASK
jgi:hypothetical protein